MTPIQMTRVTGLRGQNLPGDGPVSHGARIHGLDTVRGLALFGERPDPRIANGM
jgi:uncharacterized membrane protein YeiB